MSKIFLIFALAGVTAMNSITAQNNTMVQENVSKQEGNNVTQAGFDRNDHFLQNKFMQTAKRQKSNGDWYEPDTVYGYSVNYPADRCILEYNQQGFQTTYLYQAFENDTWKSYITHTYTCDASNNKLTELQQNWNNDTWENNTQVLRTYDENDNCTFLEYFNWEDGDWQLYDSESSRSTLFYNNMQSSVNILYAVYRITASYKKITKPVVVADISLSKILVYPNPTKGRLIIDCSKETYPIVNPLIEIYNVVGQRVLSYNSFPSLEPAINVETLPSGVYFLKIDGKTIRFIKE